MPVSIAMAVTASPLSTTSSANSVRRVCTRRRRYITILCWRMSDSMCWACQGRIEPYLSTTYRLHVCHVPSRTEALSARPVHHRVRLVPAQHFLVIDPGVDHPRVQWEETRGAGT